MSRISSAANSSVRRWGIPREPTSTDGAEQTSPGAASVLVTFLVSASKTGRCFGISISSPEANYFQLGILTGGVFTTVKDFTIAAAGSIFVEVPTPLLNGVPAGSSIQIRNVNAAVSGVPYQASLLCDQG